MRKMMRSCFLSFCDSNERKFSSAQNTAVFYYNERQFQAFFIRCNGGKEFPTLKGFRWLHREFAMMGFGVVTPEDRLL